MNKKFYLILFFLIGTFHLACAQSAAKLKTENIISFHFRRTYADAQFMKNDKEIETYYKRQEKSNPLTIDIYFDTLTLYKQFEILGCFKGNELILKKFNDLNDSLPATKISPDEKITIWTSSSDSVPYILNILQLNSGKNISIYSNELPVKYSVADIIPGGLYELVLITECHIMNGFNYDVTVYKFKEE